MEKYNFLNKTQSDEKMYSDNQIRWKPQDSIKLLYLVQKHEQNWSKISELMTNFSEFRIKECYKNIKSKWIKSPWTQLEDLHLVSGVSNQNQVNWFEKSVNLVIRSPEDWYQRFNWLISQYTNKGTWSFEEQMFIFNMLDKHGFTWKSISEHIPFRTSNAVKGLVHASLRKIKKMKSIFWCLYQFARWPTFTNKSKTIFINLIL